MSKNLTLKGAAFGALVALATTAIAGAPAHAAVSDSIVTGLASGTSYNSVVGYGNELKLSTTLAPSNSSNASTLHYSISNPSGAKLSIGLANTTTATVAVVNSGTNDGEIWDKAATPAENTTDVDSTEAGIQTDLTSFNVVPTGDKAGAVADENFITIGVADGDKDVQVTVYAWLDSSANASNVQQDTELYGNSVSLNFYDQANITATTEMVTPVTGASSVQAKFTTTPELNGQQLGADFFDTSWTTQGNANKVLAKNTSSDAAVSPTLGTTTYSGTTKQWTSTAYLAYSKANDAFSGTDSSVSSTIALSAATAATAAVAASTKATTIEGKTTGLGATNAGSFAVTISGLAATGTGTAVIAATSPVAAPVTINSATSFTYTPIAGANFADKYTPGTAADITAGVAQFWSVGTNATVLASGTYSATPYLGTVKLGATGSTANSAIEANDTKATVAVSENVAAGSNSTAATATNVAVRTETSSVTADAVIYYTDADTGLTKVAPAGIPVTGYLTANNGTFQINAAGVGVTSKTVYTDANGKVSFTLTTTTASSTSNQATLEIRPQSVGAGDAKGAKFVFDWDDAAYKIYDLKSTVDQPAGTSYRRIVTGGTYTFDFAVLDQWGKAADAAKYRLNVVNADRTVSSNTYTLTNGRVSVAVADAAQGANSYITSTVNLQKLVSGDWATQATESWDGTGLGVVQINVAAATTEKISVDADGGQLYNGTAADLVDEIANKATVAQDRRLSALTQPGYANDVRVSGQVTDSVTGLALGGQEVTITGDSGILFSSGAVDSFGTITVITGTDGKFSVQAYSTKALTDSVITYTSKGGATKTQKVTFGPAKARSGVSLAITASAATAGKTLTFTGKLTDKYGNPVDTDQDATKAAGDATLDGTDARLTVSYSGPGLLSGSLPVETGTDGTFTVVVLLGVSDSGDAKLTATYGGGNGVIATADTGFATINGVEVSNIDTVATATAAVSAPVVVLVEPTSKIGTANSRVYVNVKDGKGAVVSVKIGAKWFTKSALNNDYTFSFKAKKKSKVSVKVYVDGDLSASKTITVK